MDFFGIGFLEIVAVMLLVAIVFGPERLPEFARQAGRAVRELRGYAREFRDEYLVDFEEVKEEYLEMRQELQQSAAEIDRDLKAVDADLRSATTEITAELRAAESVGAAAVAEAGAAVRQPLGKASGTKATAAPQALPPQPHPPAAPPPGDTRDAANVISLSRRRPPP